MILGVLRKTFCFTFSFHKQILGSWGFQSKISKAYAQERKMCIDLHAPYTSVIARRGKVAQSQMGS